MKNTIIVLIGESFNGTSTETMCCDTTVAGATKSFLGQGESGGKFGFIYAYTVDGKPSELPELLSAVEDELIKGGAIVVAKVTGCSGLWE